MILFFFKVKEFWAKGNNYHQFSDMTQVQVKVTSFYSKREESTSDSLKQTT